MPLPLPDLDTRRWGDLVDEGRAQIPRYAPTWTDHNIHDPGVTLVELFAWLTEGDIYRINRIPERHRRKFLALIGHAPLPPAPSRVAVGFRLAPPVDALLVPDGTTVAARQPDGMWVPFRLLRTLIVIDLAIELVATFDGKSLIDRTRDWLAGTPLLPWESDPAAADEADKDPALYLAFDGPLRPGLPVALWIGLTGDATGPDERARIVKARDEGAVDCLPRTIEPCDPPDCAPDALCAQFDAAESSAEDMVDITLPAPPEHHGVRVAWEYFAGGTWLAFGSASGELVDDTRALTLDGMVVITPEVASDPVPGGLLARGALPAGIRAARRRPGDRGAVDQRHRGRTGMGGPDDARDRARRGSRRPGPGPWLLHPHRRHLARSLGADLVARPRPDRRPARRPCHRVRARDRDRTRGADHRGGRGRRRHGGTGATGRAERTVRVAR